MPDSENSPEFGESGVITHRELHRLVPLGDLALLDAAEPGAVDDGDVHAVARGGVATHGGIEAADGEVDRFLHGGPGLDAVLEHTVGEGRAGASEGPGVLDRAPGGVDRVDAAALVVEAA